MELQRIFIFTFIPPSPTHTLSLLILFVFVSKSIAHLNLRGHQNDRRKPLEEFTRSNVRRTFPWMLLKHMLQNVMLMHLQKKTFQ